MYNIISNSNSNLDDINDNIELRIHNNIIINKDVIDSETNPLSLEYIIDNNNNNDNDNSNNDDNINNDNILPIRTVQQLITVRNQASWFSSFSNLTSTIIGAGILG